MAFSDPGKNRSIWDKSRGPQPAEVTLAEDCALGDVLGYSTGWKRGLATAGSVIQGRCVALAPGKSGKVVPVDPAPVVRGYSGGTPGNYVYVAEGTNKGKITETKPSTTDDADTVVGIVLSATKVLFFLNSRPDSVAA